MSNIPKFADCIEMPDVKQETYSGIYGYSSDATWTRIHNQNCETRTMQIKIDALRDNYRKLTNHNEDLCKKYINQLRKNGNDGHKISLVMTSCEEANEKLTKQFRPMFDALNTAQHQTSSSTFY
jgi:hypothetical protein